MLMGFMSRRSRRFFGEPSFALRWPAFVAPLLLAALLSCTAFAAGLLPAQTQAPVLRLSAPFRTANLGPHLEILKDPERQFGVEQVAFRAMLQHFKPLEKQGTFFLDDPESDWWLKTVIQVPEGSVDHGLGWVVDAGWPEFWDWYALRDFDVYLIDEQGRIHLQRSLGSSDVSPFLHRLRFPGPGSYTLLIRVSSELPLFLPLKLEALEYSLHMYRKAGMAKSMVIGMLLAMGFIHFVLHLCIRDRAYLWYSGFLLASVSYMGVQTGLMREFLPGLWSADLGQWLDPVLLTLFSITVAQFARIFLAMRVYAPGYDRFLAGAILTGLAWLVATPFLDIVTVNTFTLVFPLLAMFTMIAAFVVRRKGFYPANHFILAFLPFFLGGPVAVLTYLGVLEYSATMFYLMPVMSMVSVLLFPYALTRRLAHLRIDTAQVQRRRDEAEQRAMTDSLTGLPNLHLFQHELVNAVREADQQDMPLVLVVLDMDGFKRLNNQHGTLVGDEALRAMGRAIRVASRESDRAFRSGGEEFSLLMPGSTAAEALRLCGRIQETMRQFKTSGEEERPVEVTLSGGIAEYASAEGPDSLMFRASRAMHRAKADGRDTVVVAE